MKDFPVQKPIQPCHSALPGCPGRSIITPTASPWEFTYACSKCTATGVISWSHEHAPPSFTPARLEPDQPSLF